MHSTTGSDWPLGIKGVVPVGAMAGDDAEDTALLLKLKQEATEYVLSCSWCVSILDMYFGDGVGGLVAVFLLHIVPARPHVDEWLWVVVGDLPSAYLVTEDLKSPYDVLQSYIEHREKWVNCAKTGKAPSPDVMPVRTVPPTPYWAEQVGGRMKTLREHVLPFFRKE